MAAQIAIQHCGLEGVQLPASPHGAVAATAGRKQTSINVPKCINHPVSTEKLEPAAAAADDDDEALALLPFPPAGFNVTGRKTLAGSAPSGCGSR